MRLSLCHAVLVCAVLAGVGAAAQDAPVATVNGQPISEKAFVERMKAQYGYSTLEQMIEDAALQQAADKAGVKVTEAQLNERVRAMAASIDRDQAQTGLNFTGWLAGQNVTFGAFKTQVRLQMLIEGIIKDQVKVTDQQVSDFYQRQRERFHVPEQVKVSHICVKTKAEAEKIRADVQANKVTFADAARQFSIDPYSKDNGGDLGAIVAGDDPLQKAAFALLKDGELSPVFETKMGFHIVKRDSRTADRVLPFEEVQKQLRGSLERQEMVKLATEKRDEILKAAQIDRKVKLETGAPPADLGGPAPPATPGK
jgi:foldase protein PrsA